MEIKVGEFKIFTVVYSFNRLLVIQEHSKTRLIWIPKDMIVDDIITTPAFGIMPQLKYKIEKTTKPNLFKKFLNYFGF